MIAYVITPCTLTSITGDSTDFEVPTMTSTAVTGYSVESLHDYFGIPTGAPGLSVGYDPSGTLYADLSQATAATINAIRVAFQVQKLLERDARGGTRYTEIIRSHFGVVSPASCFPVRLSLCCRVCRSI